MSGAFEPQPDKITVDEKLIENKLDMLTSFKAETVANKVCSCQPAAQKTIRNTLKKFTENK